MEEEGRIELLEKENEALRESNHQLRAAILSMGKSKREESLIKSRISHDIRTPMNAIVGFTSLAKEEDNSPKTQECLVRIEEATKYLLAFLNEWMQNSTKETAQQEFSLFGLLEEVEAFFTDRCSRKQAFFHLLREELHTDKAVGNEIHLKQILFTILNHAASHIEVKESIELKASTLQEDGETFVVCFTIQGPGEGITDQCIEKVFLPFEEEKEAEEKAQAEEGMLPVVNSLVSLLDGIIKVDSRAGKETSITVEIPFKKQNRRIHRRREESRDYRFTKQRILLAEDNPLNCEIVESYLKQVNLCVDIAENGKEAVQMFKESRLGYYNLILMDIRMPIMDGRAAAQRIRQLSRTDAKRVPIVAMSADAYSEEIKFAQSVGMNGYLTKPIYKEVLFQTIEKQIEKHLELFLAKKEQI